MVSVLHTATFFFFLRMTTCLGEHDKAMLSQMQDWGKEIFKIIEKNFSPTAKGQYLVAAILPDSALNKPKELPKRLLSGCPLNGPDIDEKLIQCSTSAVILNKISEDIWRRSPWRNEPLYKNHSWHGEYRLVNNGIIENLVRNFREENGDNANCRVYLYSYYIPCADISGCPYSCSDQVAAYNNRGDTKCKITVIGYTEVFRRSNRTKTNKQRAEDVLKAQTDLYHTVHDVKFLAIQSVRKNEPSSFQELLYSYLFESPLSGCCVDNTNSRDNSKRVISFFINKMVYQAVNNVTFANTGKGLFSPKIRKDLSEYFHWFLEKQVHSDCSTCPYATYNEFLIDFCSKTALDLADGFGSPSKQKDLSSPQWNIHLNSWKSLYSTSPENFLKIQSVECAHRPLSVESLCTRLPLPLKIAKKRKRSISPPEMPSDFNLAERGD